MAKFSSSSRWPREAWRLLLASVLLGGLTLAVLITHAQRRTIIKRSLVPAATLGLAAAVLAALSACTDGFRYTVESRTGAKAWKRTRMVVKQLAGLLALASLAIVLTFFTLNSVHSTTIHADYTSLSPSERIVYLVLSILTCVADAVLLVVIAQLTWRPAHRAARSAMILSSIVQIALAIILIVINGVYSTAQVSQRRDAMIFPFYQQMSAFLSATAVLGLAVCVSITEGQRMSKAFNRLIMLHTGLSFVTGVVYFALMIRSAVLVTDKYRDTDIENATLTADPVMSAFIVVLFFVSFFASRFLQEPPKSGLLVEPIDLAALSQKQQAAYARLIDLHGRSVPGSPSGQGAISLMLAYAGAAVPRMRCTVLRVYKPVALPGPRRLDRAWEDLDEDEMVLRQVVIEKDAEKVDAEPEKPKLSKRQQMKLKKQQEADQAAGLVPALEKARAPSPEEIAAEKAFQAELDSTEALVLMTTIEQYDLTAFISGIAGRILHRMLGPPSWNKFLAPRLGLLAFHWPFRQGTFYCSSSRRPVHRSAIIMRAIGEYNDHLPRSEQCGVILDPTYQHESSARAIEPSGWQKKPLPPSHVVDLRPHRGRTLPEYLKAIKYRDQEAAFKKAGGEVVESTAFTEEECADVMHLWTEIAAKQEAGGALEVLARPDERFFAQLRPGPNSTEGNDRSLLFLKAGGRTIASCVLFRLGDTITSDLQGLDHENARPLKGYFVMMQHVIAIALREGRSFVDFGPTTAKPKLDIGCKSVSLTGAMLMRSRVHRLGARLALGQLQEKEDANERNQPGKKDAQEGAQQNKVEEGKQVQNKGTGEKHNEGKHAAVKQADTNQGDEKPAEGKPANGKKGAQKQKGAQKEGSAAAHKKDETSSTAATLAES